MSRLQAEPVLLLPTALMLAAQGAGYALSLVLVRVLVELPSFLLVGHLMLRTLSGVPLFLLGGLGPVPLPELLWRKMLLFWALTVLSPVRSRRD